MKERPIIFSGPMVKAILEGRKTQTRRVVKQPNRKDGAQLLPELLKEIGVGSACPFGEIGDHLWVRETWASAPTRNKTKPSNLKKGELIEYRATYPNDSHFAWRPSIHMPRAFSRLTLEVIKVRVERVQDISRNDICAEIGALPDYEGQPYRRDLTQLWIDLWDSINAKRGYGWSVNPWVWVIEFKRVQP